MGFLGTGNNVQFAFEGDECEVQRLGGSHVKDKAVLSDANMEITIDAKHQKEPEVLVAAITNRRRTKHTFSEELVASKRHRQTSDESTRRRSRSNIDPNNNVLIETGNSDEDTSPGELPGQDDEASNFSKLQPKTTTECAEWDGSMSKNYMMDVNYK